MINRFFIIGNPRSGTTLLRLMLNKHSRISVPPEAGFLIWLLDKYRNTAFGNDEYDSFIADLLSTKKIENWGLESQDLTAYIRSVKPTQYNQVSDEVYKYYSHVKLKKNADIFGDKNNYYVKHVKDIHELYPDAKFIHIIRDGRSVAASYKEINKKNIQGEYAPKLPDAVKDIAEEWSQNLAIVNQGFEVLPDELKCEIRFEDLIDNPETELRRLSNFLNVDFESEMLNYYKTSEQEGLEPENFLQWKSKNLMPIQSAEKFKYRQLNPSDLENFENLAHNWLKKYKYL